MKKPTLNEVVDKLLSFEGKDRATMIGIGPMSHTLIKASMLLAKEKDFPLMFIASRNQVDADELGGGYVCNWDQKRFAEAIAQVAKIILMDYIIFVAIMADLGSVITKELLIFQKKKQWNLVKNHINMI